MAVWHGSLEPGERMTIGWRVSAVAEVLDVPTPTGGGPADRHRADLQAGIGADDAHSHPDRMFESPRISTDHELLDRTLARSMVDLAALRNDGPGPASTTSPPGSRGSPPCSVATA